jgi:CRP-like cAMP-binding protein
MTPLGALQLGAPPETLKDTLAGQDAVPRIIILPPRLVDMQHGVALADLEFPIYWNLFVKHRPLIVVGLRTQRAAVLAAAQECLLGPVVQDLTADVAPGQPVPDLQREHRWFRRGSAYENGILEMSDAIDFRAVDEPDGGGAFVVDGDHRLLVTLSSDGFEVSVDGDVIAQLPRDAPAAVDRVSVEAAGLEPFSPPRFGLTVLGRSHGFDPDPRERTTGFVLWIGGRGVLVDPPLHAHSIMANADIDAGLIDGLILTHVHGDHDAGILQQAMAAGRMPLWTVPSIYASWLRKWSALSGIPKAELQKLFDFHPVRVGAPLDINGAKLLFRFTLHSIPAVAFEAHYQGASFNYSGDTLNDPGVVHDMHQAGFMDDARREELTHFDWSHDLIFHESGMPPLHTPLERLEALDDTIKQRLRVLHVTPHRLQGRAGLIIAEPGRAHTIELPVEAPPGLRVIRNLSILGRTRLFHDLPIARVAELLANAREIHLPAGALLIREGEAGDALFVVIGGKAVVRRGGRELKMYGLGDSIGETAVFLRRPRNADVVALTDLDLLTVDGDVARRVCAGTDIPMLVERHDRVRGLDAWSVLEGTTLFRGLTSRQKNHLESLLVPFEMAPGHRLLDRGDVAERLALILTGQAVDGIVGHDDGAGDQAPVTMGCGHLVGDPAALLAQAPQPRGAMAHGRVTGLWLGRADLDTFLDDNPGLRVRIQPWTAATPTTNAQGMERMVTEHLVR